MQALRSEAHRHCSCVFKDVFLFCKTSYGLFVGAVTLSFRTLGYPISVRLVYPRLSRGRPASVEKICGFSSHVLAHSLYNSCRAETLPLTTADPLQFGPCPMLICTSYFCVLGMYYLSSGGWVKTVASRLYNRVVPYQMHPPLGGETTTVRENRVAYFGGSKNVQTRGT